MENTDMIGGVSPLKARGKRGGKAARANTRTAKSRGGFAKTTKSSGSSNKGGYGALTRFKAREPWKKPASSGPASTSVKAPMDNGLPDININNINTNTNYPNTDTPSGKMEQEQNLETNTENLGEWVPPVYGTRTTKGGGLPTYVEAWDQNFTKKDGKRIDKHGKEYSDDEAGYAEFEKAAKKWNKENKGGGGGSSSKTEKYLISAGYYKPLGSTTKTKMSQSQKME